MQQRRNGRFMRRTKSHNKRFDKPKRNEVACRYSKSDYNSNNQRLAPTEFMPQEPNKENIQRDKSIRRTQYRHALVQEWRVVAIDPK